MACCPRIVRTCKMRVAQQDACGIVLPEGTTGSRRDICSWVSLELSPDVESGTDIREKDNCDVVTINDIGDSQVLGFTGEITFAEWDPAMLSMFGNVPALMNNGELDGGVVSALPNKSCPEIGGIQVDFIAKNANKKRCGTTGIVAPYVQMTLPRLTNITWSGGAGFGATQINPAFTFYAEPNPNWEPTLASDPWTTDDQTAIQDEMGIFAWKCSTEEWTCGCPACGELTAA